MYLTGCTFSHNWITKGGNGLGRVALLMVNQIAPISSVRLTCCSLVKLVLKRLVSVGVYNYVNLKVGGLSIDTRSYLDETFPAGRRLRYPQ